MEKPRLCLSDCMWDVIPRLFIMEITGILLDRELDQPL